MMILTKTFTFACVHFAVAFSVAYVITGSWVLGGLLAAVEPLVNTMAFYVHEHVWARVNGGRGELTTG